MSLLCLDVRDGHTHLGSYAHPDDPASLRRWRVTTDVRRTSDEWGLLLDGLLACTGGRGSVSGVAVACTVPTVLPTLRDLVARHLGDAHPVVIGPGVRTGLALQVDNPREVGADRIADVVALAARHAGPAISVDLGTATTIDVLNARGEYAGGAIAPGVDVSLAALGRAGAQLRSVEVVAPRSVIARNTVEALQSGFVHGFAGLVDGLVDRVREQLGAPDAPVLATGDLAPVVLAQCRTVTELVPDLTLDGLRLVHARNPPP